MIIEIIIQTFLAFFAILILTRILGKQQIAQLTFYEYITGITFGSIAASMATDTEQAAVAHFIGLIFFGILTWFLSFISLKNRALQKIISGEPVIVVQKGQILENNLKKMRFTYDELLSELRSKDVFNFQDVEFAILEPSGKISVLKKPEADTPSCSDLGITKSSEGLGIEVVVDGQLIYENLKSMNLDAKWLINQLNIQGVKGLKKVAFASVNAEHQLYVDLYKDNKKDMIDISDNDVPLTMDTISVSDKEEKN